MKRRRGSLVFSGDCQAYWDDGGRNWPHPHAAGKAGTTVSTVLLCDLDWVPSSTTSNV